MHSSSRMPGASIISITTGCGPPRSGWVMKVSIAPSLVAMSRVWSIMASSGGEGCAAEEPFTTVTRVQASAQLARRLPASYAIADDERWKNLHYGACGVLSPSLGLEFLSWKTGEGIAIAAGGAILMMILVVVAAAVTAADEITAEAAAMAAG